MKRRKRDIELRCTLVMFVDVDHEKARSGFQELADTPKSVTKTNSKQTPCRGCVVFVFVFL
jgi:hypothetical protein